MSGEWVPDHLEADAVQASIDRLARRIRARFPERSLAGVAGHLRSLADEVEDTSDSSRLRLRVMRWVTGLLAAALAVATAVVVGQVVLELRADGLGEPADLLAREPRDVVLGAADFMTAGIQGLVMDVHLSGWFAPFEQLGPMWRLATGESVTQD